jgi:RNA polymerase sigma factor for flagellar operon FliA
MSTKALRLAEDPTRTQDDDVHPSGTRVAAASSRRVLSREDYERFTPLVRRIAISMGRRLPKEIALSDLISYGWLGLLEAYNRAPSHLEGEELEAYLSYRVRGAILDHLRSLDPMVRAARATSRRIARAVSDQTQKLGRPPEETEIATALGLDLDGYRVALQRVAEAGMARLELMDFDQVECDDEGADDHVDRKMRVEAVASAIKQLPERLQHVLALYYQEGCTLQQIGRVLGVTEARVCQLHSEAMHRLRAMIGRS